LSQILRSTEMVLLNSVEILDSLLDNHGFREGSSNSLRMERVCSSSRDSCFRIPKPVLISRPDIVSVLLFSRAKSTMSFVIHR